MGAYLSIIMPVKNGAEIRLAQRCIETLQINHAQIVPLVQLILVDYGLSNLSDVLNRQINFPNKRIISSPEATINQAYNQGMKNSDGKVVFLLENNIYFIEPSLHILANLIQVTGAGVVAPLVLYPNRTVERAGVVNKKIKDSEPGWFAPYLRFQRASNFEALALAQRIVAEKCIGISRQTIEKIGYLDEKLSYLYACVNYCMKSCKNGSLTYHVGYTSVIYDPPQSTNMEEESWTEYVIEKTMHEEEDRKKIYSRWPDI
jgi:glycosyltransferase involved in cell wall biosynthesis